MAHTRRPSPQEIKARLEAQVINARLDTLEARFETLWAQVFVNDDHGRRPNEWDKIQRKTDLGGVQLTHVSATSSGLAKWDEATKLIAIMLRAIVEGAALDYSTKEAKESGIRFNLIKESQMMLLSFGHETKTHRALRAKGVRQKSE